MPLTFYWIWEIKVLSQHYTSANDGVNTLIQTSGSSLLEKETMAISSQELMPRSLLSAELY